MPNKKLEQHRSFFKWKLFEDAPLEGEFDMPVLQPIQEIPRDLVVFHSTMSVKNPENCWFHFYEEDYQFERVWNNPKRYLSVFKRYAGGIGPDFSMYLDMPESQQIWNCWRNRVLTYWMQSQEILTVPNACWGDSRSFEWAFDGLPENSILSITTQGCIRNKICKWTLLNGIHELINAKHPTALFVYGLFPDEWRDKLPVPVVIYPSYSEEKWGA